MNQPTPSRASALLKGLHLSPGPARELLVLACYAALTVVVTWPIIGRLGTHLLCARFDVWGSLWFSWWMERMLIGPEAPSLFSAHLGYPLGINIAFIDAWLYGVVSVPFRALFGAVTGYNITAIVAITLGAYGAYRMGLYFLGSGLAAFLCGALFGYNACVGNYIIEGLGPLLWTLWIPLSLKATFQLTERRLAPLAAGVLLALAFYTSGYYGSMCVGLAALAVIYQLVTRGRRRALLARWAAALAVCAVLVSPLAYKMHQGLDDGYSEYRGFHELEVTSYDDEPHLFEMLMVMAVSSAAPIEGILTPRSEGYHDSFLSVYLGYSALALALVGLWSTRRRLVIFCLPVGLFFLVLSLGPYMNVDGRHEFHLWGEEYVIPLPYYYIYRVIPYFGLFKFSYRFSIVAHLCLALAAGCGLLHLQQQRRQWAKALGMALFAACVVEATLVACKPPNIPLVDARIPKVYHEIQKEPGDFAVLDITGEMHFFYERIMFFSTITGRPIPYFGGFRRNIDMNDLFIKVFQGRLNQGFPDKPPILWNKTKIVSNIPKVDRAILLKVLRQLNIRYVLVHDYSFTSNRTQEVDPSVGAKLVQVLQADLGAPVVHANVPVTFTGRVFGGKIHSFKVPGVVSKPLPRTPRLRANPGLVEVLEDEDLTPAQQLLWMAETARKLVRSSR